MNANYRLIDPLTYSSEENLEILKGILTIGISLAAFVLEECDDRRSRYLVNITSARFDGGLLFTVQRRGGVRAGHQYQQQ
jgi:hypothetical protein